MYIIYDISFYSISDPSNAFCLSDCIPAAAILHDGLRRFFRGEARVEGTQSGEVRQNVVLMGLQIDHVISILSRLLETS